MSIDRAGQDVTAHHNPPDPGYPDYRGYPDYPSVKSAAKLLETQMAPTRWAVPSVLPEGVSLLAGKPKKGKSWMALGLCEAIAAGGVAFGTKRVEKGEALYLALEDNERRMQKRLKKVLDGRECPPGLHYAVEWPRLEEGGTEALERWLTATPGARLVVIDTLQKIRKPARGQNVYAEDYAALEALLPLASRHGVAIVVVHHLRKGESDDPQDEISGSTGLSGGVDGYLILRQGPGGRGRTLYVDGRDIEQPEEYALNWNVGTATWTIEGTAEEVHISDQRGAVLVELNRSPEPMTPKEVSEMLPGQKHQNVKVLLGNMLRDGQVIKGGVGKYEPAHRTNPDYPTDYPTNQHRNADNGSEGNRVIGVIGVGRERPASWDLEPGESATVGELRTRRDSAGGDSSAVAGVYSHQTPSLTNGNGGNKSKASPGGPPEPGAEVSPVAGALLRLFEEYPGLAHERDPGNLARHLARFGQPRDRFARREGVASALQELYGRGLLSRTAERSYDEGEACPRCGGDDDCPFCEEYR